MSQASSNLAQTFDPAQQLAQERERALNEAMQELGVGHKDVARAFAACRPATDGTDMAAYHQWSKDVAVIARAIGVRVSRFAHFKTVCMLHPKQ